MDDLEHVLRSAGLPRPDKPLRDLGSLSRTHVFVFDHVVVKYDDPSRTGAGSAVREAQALEFLESSDLPVPRLVDVGDFPDGRRWIVMTRLLGTPPHDASRPGYEISTSLAEQLGVVIARLHATARPPGFGTWSLPPARTFVEEHWHRIGLLEEIAKTAGVVPLVEVQALLELLHGTDGPLDDIRQPTLAHRDVQPRNVLVSPSTGALTGLLDFESAAGGDPAEDFRVIGLDWRSPGFAAFASAYATAGGSLGESGPDRIAHYVLVWVLAVFAYVGRVAPEHLPPARAAVERVRSGDRPKLFGV